MSYVRPMSAGSIGTYGTLQKGELADSLRAFRIASWCDPEKAQ